MRLRTILLSLLLVVLTACSDVDKPLRPAGGQATTDRGLGSDGDADCDPRFSAALDRWGARGFSGTVAIRLDDESVCRWAAGVADPETGRTNDPDTVFSIGSIAKTFTAATLLDLADRGVLSVDDRLGDWLTELDGPGTDITLAQLLAHTSGLGAHHGEDHRPLTEEELVAALAETGVDPGTEFRYSNTGYSALALVIERASEQPFREALLDAVLVPVEGGQPAIGGWWDGEPRPTGERAFGVVGGEPGHRGGFDGPHWALDGNGGLAMSMPDLAAWVDDLAAGRIIAEEAVDAMLEPAWDHGDGTGETFGFVVVGREADRDLMYGASGGGGQIGHEAGVLLLPELDAVVAVAANTATVAPATIMEGLITALLEDTDLAGPPDIAEADGALLAETGGRYRLAGGGDFLAEPGDEVLTIQPLDGPALARFLPAPSGVDPATHAADVEAFLFGATPAGAEEQASLESLLGGPLTDIEHLGTGWIEGELRTYVIVRSATDERSAWFALEPSGELAAAEVPAAWPTIEFVPVGSTRFAAVDARTSPVVIDVTHPDRLMIESPDEAEQATRVDGSGGDDG